MSKKTTKKKKPAAAKKGTAAKKTTTTATKSVSGKLAEQLKLPLFTLRLGVFVVMLMWTLDKFINPQHSAAVWGHFYKITGLEANLMAAIGVIQMVVIVAFLAGLAKKWSYGVVLLLHTVSTLSSYKMYLSPYEPIHLLFFAAWPMLAACFALYMLRDYDTLYTLTPKHK